MIIIQTKNNYNI